MNRERTVEPLSMVEKKHDWMEGRARIEVGEETEEQ